jgi:PGF-CTERM protein
MSEAVTDLGGDGGFTVAETGDPGTIYTVSEIDVGGSAEFVILTVEDMAESGAEGVDVTYNASDPNGTITDIAGNDLATNTTGVTVAAWDTEAPTVSGVSSTTGNGSYKAGDPIAVTVTFSEVVTVTGIPQITLETGDTDRDVNCTSGTGTTVLTFNYIVQAGDTSSDLDYTATNALALNGGTIKNAAGNDATLTLAAPGTANSLGANKAIVIDTTAPTLNIWTLDIGAKTATLTFNESVNASTLDVTAVTIQDAATATTSYPLTDSTTASSNGASIVIALSATDFNAIIADSGLAVNNETSWMTITAAAIDDVAGNEVTAITDGNGLQATTYTAGTLDHINVTPTSASLNTTGDNETTFTATAKDRYGNNKSVTFTWGTIPSGVGTLNDTTGSVVNFTAAHVGRTEIYAVNGSVVSSNATYKVWVTVNAATNTTEVEGGNATATSGDSTAIVNLTNTTVSGTINFTEMGDPVNSSAAGGSTAGLGTNVLIKGVDVNVSINITHAMTDDASGNSYVYIQIDYNQSHIDGLGIDENTLHIYKWVTSSSSWVKLVEGSPSYCVANGRNTTANYVYANVTECSILGLGGSVPSGGSGGSTSTGGGSGTYPPGWFGTPTPTVTATKAPIATTTATDAPSGERVTPTPAKRPDATKTTTPTATETAKTDTPGLTAVFAIAGLLAVAYAMMRRRS